MTGTEAIVVMTVVVVASALKTLTGMGFGLITVPIISLLVGIEEAVASVSLANVAINGGMVWHERQSYPSTRDLPTLGATAVLGSVAGTILLVSVPEAPLMLTLSAVVFVYIALFFAIPSLSIGAAASARLAPVVGAAAGFLHGTTGISGPVVGTWVHAFRLERGPHILSVTSLYLMAGLTQAVVLISQGALQGRWGVALAAVVPALMSVPIGRRFRDRISTRAFDLAVVAVLAGSGLALALQALF